MVLTFHSKHFYALVGKESTYGTAVTANKNLGLIQDFVREADSGQREDHSVSSANPQQTHSASAGFTGNFSMLFQQGRIFEYALGSVTHDATNTPDIKHTFTLSDDLPSMTFEGGHNSSGTDRVFTTKGLKISSLNLKQEIDASMRIACDYNARDLDPSSTTSQAAGLSTLTTFPHFFSTLSWGTAGAESALSVVMNYDWMLNSAGARDMRQFGIESRLANASEANSKTMKFKFAIALQDATFFNDVLGNTTGALDTGAEIALKGMIFNAHNNVAAASGRREIKIDMSDCMIKTAREIVTLGDYTILEIEGAAKTLDDFFTYDNITAGNW